MTPEKWYKRLNVQLVALLTLALLPLGAVAIFQTNQVSVQAERSAAISLLGLTERAARAEQDLIERAIGAGQLLREIAPDLVTDPNQCEPLLSSFVGENSDYNAIDVYTNEGDLICSSRRDPIAQTDFVDNSELVDGDEPAISLRRPNTSTEESEFVISSPFITADNVEGVVSIAVPHERIAGLAENMTTYGLVELITFNEAGVTLTTRGNMVEATLELPENRTLADITTTRSFTFADRNRLGERRRYSVVAIDGVPAAVMAIWEREANPISNVSARVAPVLFPILMWVASMGVAMLAMQTLVLRHVKRIQRDMDRFAETRHLKTPDINDPLLPSEIEELESRFHHMGREIVLDEAELENSLREKGVLVKEIHHRVKNNLQLISSIMNMQIRAATQDETRTTLRRVQERVLSLATIHRDLYQSEDGGQVNVGGLVREIIQNAGNLVKDECLPLDVNVIVDDLMLYPDQAVPLSLLTAEAAGNAFKYLASEDVGGGAITVKLRSNQSGSRLTIANTVTNDFAPPTQNGLGIKLIKAFAQQLGGVLTAEHVDDEYRVIVEFEARDFELEAKDY